MKRLYPLKIDIASHILPTKYKKAIDEIAPGHVQQDKKFIIILNSRIKIRHRYISLIQVILTCLTGLTSNFINTFKRRKNFLSMEKVRRFMYRCIRFTRLACLWALPIF